MIFFYVFLINFIVLLFKFRFTVGLYGIQDRINFSVWLFNVLSPTDLQCHKSSVNICVDLFLDSVLFYSIGLFVYP